MKIKIFTILIIFCFVLGAQDKIDKKWKEYFDVMSLILTKTEIKIIKHLPTLNDKLNFLQECWDKRDPDTNTEENEGLLLFIERVKYCNSVLKENFTPGWKTDKGRIVIYLGLPNNVEEITIKNDDQEGKRYIDDYDLSRMDDYLSGESIVQIWTYIDLKLILKFYKRDFTSSWKLLSYDPRLLEIIEYSKILAGFNLKTPDGNLKNSFKFKSKYDKSEKCFNYDNIIIKIKNNNINYKEINNNRMNCKFNVQINIYKNYKLYKKINFGDLNLTYFKDHLLKCKNIEFLLRFESFKEKGKYIFFIIIEDKYGNNISLNKWQETLRRKI